MSRIKAYIFDAGDILFDATKWRKWLHKYLKDNNLTQLTYSEMFHIWDSNFLYEVYRGRMEYSQAFEQFLLFLQLSKTQIKIVKKASDEKKPVIEASTKPYKWVYEKFPAIKKKGIKIGILTDSEKHLPAHKKRYRKAGLLQYIDVICSSADTGFVKPDPRAYKLILKKLGIKPSEAVFIGHDKDELIGAKNIGMNAVLLKAASKGIQII